MKKQTPPRPTKTANVLQALRQGMQLHQQGRLDQAEPLYRAILTAQPNHFDAGHMLGVLRYQQGRHAEAAFHIGNALRLKPNVAAALSNFGLVLGKLGRPGEALAKYDKALALKPDYAEAHNNRGTVLFELRRHQEALTSYDRALVLRPHYAEAHNNRGAVLLGLKRPEEALASYGKALALKPGYADAHFNRGDALRDLKRPAEALASYDKALAIKSEYPEALNNRGNAILDLKRPAEALVSYDKALALNPEYPEALNNRCIALLDLKRPEDALVSCNKALVLRPDYTEAHNNRGTALLNLKRFVEALASFDRALALKPEYANALNNRGNVLRDLKRPGEAVASYNKALALRPDYAEVHNNRGNALHDLKLLEEALVSYDRALALKPDYANALNNRGNVLFELKRQQEALASYDKALASDPDHPHACRGLAGTALHCCDWDRTEQISQTLARHIADRRSVIMPFGLLGYRSSAPTQLECARLAVQSTIPIRPAPLWQGTIYRHEKIRVAYLSADYRRHAMAYQMAELFEVHDRTRFEVIGISYGPDDGSDIRKRIAVSFDAFIDVRQMSDHQVATLLRGREVDIAVDLMGHTTDCRTEILAHRPAPIQVNYLGYPGTMGADFIDYVIADPIVLPFDQQPYYTERIVHLPDCYQANDSKRTIAAETPTRRAAGLPETGFVFCCFNNNYKITREVFEIWMRLLREIEGSVLWLVCGNDAAKRNICAEARTSGVVSERLIFAESVPLDQHLARHRLADLFLDTLPYNVHGTGSMALWAGLPFITCLGETLQSRVGASLLKAVGLPELVTQTLAEYERLARRLARDSMALQAITSKLQENRRTCALFDTDRFRRHIEAAYVRMWEIHHRGERPQSFHVDAIE